MVTAGFIAIAAQHTSPGATDKSNAPGALVVYIVRMPRQRKSSQKKSVKILSSKVVYRGPVFQITSDIVREPSGAKVRRDIVRHSGSVVMMAVEGSNLLARGKAKLAAGPEPRVLLVRQYRYTVNDFIWELPAGRIDEGEDELPAAKRELLEETGYTAARWKRVLFFYVSPGFLDETMAVYLAEELTAGQAQPEEDEFIVKRFFTLSQALRLVMRGKVRDAKTISSVLWLNQAIKGHKARPEGV
jgi:ADP-ribose pyrophosphatase